MIEYVCKECDYRFEAAEGTDECPKGCNSGSGLFNVTFEKELGNI